MPAARRHPTSTLHVAWARERTRVKITPSREAGMLFSIAMFPIGTGPSIRKPVAEVIDEIDKAGLHYEVGPADTVIEGEWDEVMPVLKQAEERLRINHGRVFMLITVDDYVGVGNQLHTAVVDVEQELHRTLTH
jgi:uncharacterized protein (TIGR00106 family)